MKKELFNINLDTVRELAEIVKFHKLDELTVEADGCGITLQRNQPATTPFQQPYDNVTHVQTVECVAEEPEPVSVRLPITAPTTGVFYASPSPSAPHFVKVGDHIEEGQTICIIEAMKTFNEIPASFSGVVVEILAENNQLVNNGDTLFLVEPAAPPDIERNH